MRRIFLLTSAPEELAFAAHAVLVHIQLLLHNCARIVPLDRTAACQPLYACQWNLAATLEPQARVRHVRCNAWPATPPLYLVLRHVQLV